MRGGRPGRRRRTSALGLCAAALLGACTAAGPQLHEFNVNGQALELAQVPFVRAESHRGGPAALAMALGAAGLQADPASFDEAIQQGEDRDDTRSAVVQAVLARGYVPSLIQSRTVDLEMVRELRAGHPVVVLLFRGLLMRNWQYGVVFGVDPAANRFLLRTGAAQRLSLNYPELLAGWEQANYWALVVTRPDDIPATAMPAQWLQRTAELARLGYAQRAGQAALAATRRWPAEPQAWAELGRQRTVERDLRGATDAYLRALRLAPGDAALHAGLAQLLEQRQCGDQALDEIGQAVAQESDPRQRAAYQRLQRELDRRSSGPSVVCQLD